MEEKVIQLVQAAAQGDQQANQQIEQIMQAAQQGDQQAIQIAQMIQQVIETMKQQQGIKAKLGAKLQYIRKIKGLCPEGEELVYMKKGGKVCPVCQKKKEEVKMAQKGNAITDFKDSRKKSDYDVNEHNRLIKKYQAGKTSKEELRKLQEMNKHPEATHEESYQATKRSVNKKTLVKKNACGSKMKKK